MEREQDPVLADSLLGLRYISSSLHQRRYVASLTFLSVIALGVAFVALVPAKYTATAIILIDPRQQTVVQSEDVLPGIGSDPAAVESQVELLRSAAVSPPLLQKHSVYSDPEFNKSSISTRLFALLSSDAKASTPHESLEAIGSKNKAINAFQRNLYVRRRGLTYVLDVSFTSEDPQKAATIANSVANAYLSGESARRQDAAKHASVWLTDRLKNLREQVRTSEQAVADYKQKFDIVDLGRTDSGETLGKSQIDLANEQLSAARAETARQKARYDQAVLASANFNQTERLQEVLSSPVVGNLRVAYSDLKRAEVRDAGIFGAKHPSLLNIQRELQTVELQINDEVQRIVASLQTNYDVALKAEQSLERDLQSQKTQSAEINQITVKLRELERTATADQNVHDQFLNRLKETTEQITLRKPDAEIISLARIPTRSSGPRKSLVVSAAIVLGLLLAIAMALITSRFPQSGSRTNPEPTA
ncbi:MAG: GumC family protein [Hyphomicrobiales bacterium]